MVFAFLKLGPGNEPPQPLEVAGHTPSVETADFDLNNLAVLGELLHLVPALAQSKSSAADGDHAIGVLFAGDQHLQFEAFGKTFLEIGDHPKSAFALGHEAGSLASDVDIDTITLHADHRAGHHFTCGANRFIGIECREKSILVEIEIVDAAARCRLGG